MTEVFPSGAQDSIKFYEGNSPGPTTSPARTQGQGTLMAVLKISSLTLCTSSAPKRPEYLSDISLAILRKEKMIEAEKTFKTKLPFIFQNGLKVDAVFSGYCFLLYPQMCGIKHPFNRVQYDKTKLFFLDYCSWPVKYETLTLYQYCSRYHIQTTSHISPWL